MTALDKAWLVAVVLVVAVSGLWLATVLVSMI